jgi:CDP-diglyceride synthetase
MLTAVVAMMAALADEKTDPIKELVLKFLLSYGGIAGGVSFLVEGLKTMFKKFVDGREPLLVILLTFAMGSAAKFLSPDVFGPKTTTGWGLHLLILVFVAVGAAAFHDKFLSVLTGLLPKKDVGDVGSGSQSQPPPGGQS